MKLDKARVRKEGEGMILELKRLNSYEMETIIKALKDLAKARSCYSGPAEILLENDAEFVRGLFWTSKESPNDRQD